MAVESVATRTGAINDAVEQRAIAALLQSIVLDLAALKLAHNTHTHTGVTVGAASSGLATVGLVGNLNTTA